MHLAGTKRYSSINGSQRLRSILRASTALVLVWGMVTGYGTALADTTSLADLGTLDPSFPSASARSVSNNGAIVVGNSSVSGPYTHAFYWTPSGGIIDLGTLSGTGISLGLAVNSGGTVVVGTSVVSTGQLNAFRWTQATGMINLGVMWQDPASFSAAFDVSTDGATIIGYGLVNATDYHAFRWTSAGGMVDLGAIAGGNGISAGYAVSGDGSIIVGIAGVAGGYTHAMRWDQINGMVDLGTIGGFLGNSQAADISSDGSTIVGSSKVPGFTHAMRYTQGGGMEDMGTLGNVAGNSSALAVSGDGAIIVGNSAEALKVHTQATRWTAATGLTNLNTLLANAGVDMTGIELTSANGISANGQFIVGTGLFGGQIYDSAFLVRYIDDAVTLGGLTSAESVQNSIDDLGEARSGAAVQMQGFAAQLLGANAPFNAPNQVSAFGAVGSASGGVAGKVGLANGFSLLGGLSLNREDFKDVRMHNTIIGALVLRYTLEPSSAGRIFVEGGGWVAPDGSFTFTRQYDNGAGAAIGTGDADGSLGYAFVKGGTAYDLSANDELVLAAELGQSWFHTDAYVEPVGPSNPFEAHVSAGTDKLTVTKLEAKLTHAFTPALDATLRTAVAHGFAASSSVETNVIGFGVISPAQQNPSWVEYGVRAGYKLSENMTLDIFANGVSGNDGVRTETHVGGDITYTF